MSLNGLDDPKVADAHEAAAGEPGGWYGYALSLLTLWLLPSCEWTRYFWLGDKTKYTRVVCNTDHSLGFF